MADYHDTYSHLETLIVDKAFQGKGIGSALLNFYEADLEKMGIQLIEYLPKLRMSECRQSCRREVSLFLGSSLKGGGSQ
jgi:ribosomal protein S18 acetylase RimI-like enzyme